MMTITAGLLAAVVACSAMAATSRQQQRQIRPEELKSKTQTREFDVGMDGPGRLVGEYKNGKLLQATVSLGLSNARLDWKFQITEGQVTRFSVIRNYHAWDARREEFTSSKIDHRRRVDYQFTGGRVIKLTPGDDLQLADDLWTKRQILELFEIVRDYLRSGRREVFERKLESVVK